MIRFGLCCLFTVQPIRFRQTTAKNLLTKSRSEQLAVLSQICLHNVVSVQQALSFLEQTGIGAFRITTPLLPLYTHPQVGYSLEDLPHAATIYQHCREIKALRRDKNIRLSLHPDQFNVLSSPRPEVVANTIRELEYQGELAELLDVEMINIHAGGVYGDKKMALSRLQNSFFQLSERVRCRLSLENDDISYTPSDLLPVCRRLNIPMVYDVHHHRCLPDQISVEEATASCVDLWLGLGREPCFHLSSPRNGWKMDSPRPHADYIDPEDFPECWHKVTATIEIEAKAKELAVMRLMSDLAKKQQS
ncbi:MAG: UV DNA damage repair endonuclease UvsE [Desulfobulbaceae bacterium]|nr:UV DNA damage repair endonuclease UvsE [Desulfobulbaceae bacterium]